MPFVLHSQPAAAYNDGEENMVTKMAPVANRRYSEIMRDVETLIKDHSECKHSIGDWTLLKCGYSRTSECWDSGHI